MMGGGGGLHVCVHTGSTGEVQRGASPAIVHRRDAEGRGRARPHHLRGIERRGQSRVCLRGAAERKRPPPGPQAPAPPGGGARTHTHTHARTAKCTALEAPPNIGYMTPAQACIATSTDALAGVAPGSRPCRRCLGERRRGGGGATHCRSRAGLPSHPLADSPVRHPGG